MIRYERISNVRANWLHTQDKIVSLTYILTDKIPRNCVCKFLRTFYYILIYRLCFKGMLLVNDAFAIEQFHLIVKLKRVWSCTLASDVPDLTPCNGNICTQEFLACAEVRERWCGYGRISEIIERACVQTVLEVCIAPDSERIFFFVVLFVVLVFISVFLSAFLLVVIFLAVLLFRLVVSLRIFFLCYVLKFEKEIKE